MALRFGRFKENYIGIYAVLFVMNVLDEKLFFGRERKFEESVTFISSLQDELVSIRERNVIWFFGEKYQCIILKIPISITNIYILESAIMFIHIGRAASMEVDIARTDSLIYNGSQMLDKSIQDKICKEVMAWCQNEVFQRFCRNDY